MGFGSCVLPPVAELPVANWGKLMAVAAEYSSGYSALFPVPALSSEERSCSRSQGFRNNNKQKAIFVVSSGSSYWVGSILSLAWEGGRDKVNGESISFLLTSLAEKPHSVSGAGTGHPFAAWLPGQQPDWL